MAGLPHPVTSFVGRIEVIAEVRGLLEAHRLVTLTGSGGCGKTRLALEVARRSGNALGDPVFVDLASLESPGLVAGALANALGVSESGALPLVDVVVNALCAQRLLLVFDNCEHVVEECAPILLQILIRCPEVRVLATSREPVGVEGEVTWRVPSLSLPQESSADAIAALSDCESGLLFLERARLGLPGYEPTPSDAMAAVTICRRLDGMPLAIELAASRLRMLDVPALAAALQDRFALLDAGPRTAPARHRTLEASIDWSHELLSKPEQRLFRRLGVFAAAFDVAAAAGVSVDDELPPGDVLGLLGRLVDRSMLQVERGPDGVRYRMLESIRHFARRQLAAAGEEDEVRNRHLDHHLGVAERFRVDVDAPTAASAVVRATSNSIDDMRSALDWSETSGRLSTGLRLATALRWLWVSDGRIQEGRERLAAMLAAHAEHAPGQNGTRADALCAAAMLALFAGDPFTQRELATEALELSQAAAHRIVEGEALMLLGWAATFLNPPAAHGLLSEGLARLEGTGLDRSVEYGHIGLGVALANEGRLPEAAAALATAAELARPARSWAAQFALGALGYVETLQGELQTARDHLREALSGDYSDMFQNQTRQWYALTITYLGDYDGAGAEFAAAEQSLRDYGTPFVPGWLHFALLELARARPGEAIALANTVLPFLQMMGWRWFETQARRVLGDAAEAAGDLDAAAGHWQAAMAASKSSDNPLADAVASIGLARHAAATGDPVRARALLRSALRAAVGSNYRLGAIDALEASGVVAAALSDSDDDAVRLLAAADAERSRIGYVRFLPDRAPVKAAVAATRQALGDRHDELWAEGSALSLDEATRLACRGEARPPRPPSGWASLTPAELRVVDLVTAGLSNPEIGERLFISRRTVQTHLSRVFAKLGVASRTELATLASRREPEP